MLLSVFHGDAELGRFSCFGSPAHILLIIMSSDFSAPSGVKDHH